MGISRRDFLTRVGAAGGYGAAFLTMNAIGLVPPAAAFAEPLAVAPGTGKGVKVAILGGGIAGLVAAYEMRALGYDCTVLEARTRPGGRNWTVRGGDKVVFSDGTTQTCTWDAPGYQNVGPARLPSIHHTMLGYCRKLGVELQVEVNSSRSSFLQNDAANGGANQWCSGRPINDTRGHVSELLSKCVSAGNLDADMTKDDRDRMLDVSCARTARWTVRRQVQRRRPRGLQGDARSGRRRRGKFSDPIDMHTLLDENFWQGMLFEETFDMQATMFQPVGGMDRIPYAFAKSLGKIVAV